jgi:hypothetical protein
MMLQQPEGGSMQQAGGTRPAGFWSSAVSLCVSEMHVLCSCGQRGVPAIENGMQKQQLGIWSCIWLQRWC